TAREGEVAFFAGEDVFTEDQATIGFAVDVFEHFAFAAAGCSFVHDDDAVVVGGDDLDGGAVCGDPALLFAEVDEHSVHAFFGGGTGIEVVAEQFVHAVGAIVDNDLFALEVGVPEGR